MFKPKYFLDKIVFRFTHFPFIYHKENISDMYNHVIRVYCIIVSCMIVLLVRGVRGDCSGPSDGNCARISEEREDRTPHLHSAPPRVRVLGCRCSVVTIRGPGPSHWTPPFIRTSGTRPFEVPRSQF